MSLKRQMSITSNSGEFAINRLNHFANHVNRYNFNFINVSIAKTSNNTITQVISSYFHMSRPSTQTYPDWVLPYKTKGHEIKLVNARYYLYQISSHYDKETKKRRKTSKYLGVITETEGLKEPKAAVLERLSDEHGASRNVKSVRSYEAGVSEFFLKHMSWCPTLLQKYFPEHWQTVIALAYNRLVYKAPIKDTYTFWESSYLSEFYKDVPQDDDLLWEALEEIGCNGSHILAYCQESRRTNDEVVGVPIDKETIIDQQITAHDYADPHLKNKDIPQGWLLIEMVALQWRRSLSGMVNPKGNRDIDEVNSAINLLVNVRRIRMGDQWILSETTPYQQKLLKSLQLDID